MVALEKVEGLLRLVHCPVAPGENCFSLRRKEIVLEAIATGSARNAHWNKGKLTGEKPPLRLRKIWAIRIHLQLASETRDLAMFNLAIDSKLRACDLTKLRVSDICLGSRVANRATVMQQKTQRLVKFEKTDQTRASSEA